MQRITAVQLPLEVPAASECDLLPIGIGRAFSDAPRVNQTMRLALLCAMVAGAVGCNGRENVQCEQDPNCDLSGGGKCVAVEDTGNRWCAYPDPGCPGGYRYSDQDIGDGVSGQCVPYTEPPGTSFTLTVATGGSGKGTVTSTPAGLACSTGTCTYKFDVGTQVALTASASTGMFLGWSEACTGAGTCAVTMDRDRTVAALFGTPGEALWSFQLGGPQRDEANAVAVDSNSDVYAAGTFQGSFMVGTTMLMNAGGSDIFLAKLSGATGALIWIKPFGSAGNDVPVAIAVDASDNVYLAGNFAGPIDFGGGTRMPVGNVDAFVVKLSSTGQHVWSESFGGPNLDSAAGLAVAGSTVAVVGSFSSSFTVSGRTFTTTGTGGYAVTYTTAGAFVRAIPFTGSGYCNPHGVAVDSAGSVVVGGTFNGTIDLGRGTATTTNNNDVFVSKFSSAGAFLLGKTFGGTSADAGGEISVDAMDNILITGTFSGSVNFGGPTVDTNSNNLAVIKYSAAGSYRWAQVFGGTTAQLTATRSNSNPAGDVVVAGYFCGNLAFGGNINMASVQACGLDVDMFAVRLAAADGTPLTGTRAGGSSQDAAYGVAQAVNGHYFLAGNFSGFADFGGQARTAAGPADAIVIALAPL